MKRRYRVTVEADFEIEGYSPEQIKEKLMKVIKHQGFNNLNFEIEVSRVQHQVDTTPQQYSETKVEPQEVKQKLTRKRKTEKETTDVFAKYLGRDLKGGGE